MFTENTLEMRNQYCCLPGDDFGAISVYHQFAIRAQKRDELMAFLDANGIQCAIHYATPIHLQPIYVDLFGFEGDSYPKSEALSKDCLSLPMHPFISDDDAEDVCETIREFYEK